MSNTSNEYNYSIIKQEQPDEGYKATYILAKDGVPVEGADKIQISPIILFDDIECSDMLIDGAIRGRERELIKEMLEHTNEQ